ncbi:N-acyl-D-amino-acid deacylase family protein [Rubrivivax sp. RP6-9]|uniref:N-acyl-D-amino-acid deacylase family protein n=1 Tax=Rubrivivax sp. RP6-9 TaxID=3415750 RepID=UPI003CC52EDE
MNDARAPAADVLVRGGTLVDGTGAPARRADVAIGGGRIVAVGDLGKRCAARIVDARGLTIAPGFIDAHAHDDAAAFDAERLHPKLSQGVTTVIVGHCGLSAAPLVASRVPAPLDLLGDGAFRHARFADYLDALDAAQPAVNVAALVGHTTLRVREMTDLARPATARERRAMAHHVAEALDAGAFGVSTGVFYAPARAADTDEIVEVCAAMAGSSRVLSVHLRDEGDSVLSALDEALGIGVRLQVRTVISHHKLTGARNHGRSAETLHRLRLARLSQQVCQDCYPYAASSTVLDADRLAIAARVLVTHSAAEPGQAGRDLHDIARDWGLPPASAARRLAPARAIYFSMHEADVERILADSETMIGSDGLPWDPVPHPRLWGSFARMLAWARSGGLPLETAVHRMSGLTAARWGLADRGVVAPGAAADLVLFDADRIADRATYALPAQPAEGIFAVWVNGVLAWQGGSPTGLRAGTVLRAS